MEMDDDPDFLSLDSDGFDDTDEGDLHHPPLVVDNRQLAQLFAYMGKKKLQLVHKPNKHGGADECSDQKPKDVAAAGECMLLPPLRLSKFIRTNSGEVDPVELLPYVKQFQRSGECRRQ